VDNETGKRHREVRWDLSGCNLCCLFCWSPASRSSETGDPTRMVMSREVVAKTLGGVIDKSRAFIRFTGGEPTLQWRGLSDALDQMQREITPPRPPILFQTNGIRIGKGEVDLDGLTTNPNRPYLFELSFKGTSRSEFALLTGKSEELYEHQVEGYHRLLELSRRSENVSVVAVLGVYHSSTRKPSKYAFVDPRSGDLLFEDLASWDPNFSSLWRSAPQKWVEPLRMSPKGMWTNLLRGVVPLP
jgi:uncharacterized Fe-S cluster-containing radical SAM superfamily protein